MTAFVQVIKQARGDCHAGELEMRMDGWNQASSFLFLFYLVYHITIEDAPNATQDDKDRPEVKAAESSVQAPDGFNATPSASTLNTGKLKNEVIEHLGSKLLNDLGFLETLRGEESVGKIARTQAHWRRSKLSAGTILIPGTKLCGRMKEEADARLVHEYVVVAQRAASFYKSLSKDWEILLPDYLKQVIDWLQPYLSKATKALQLRKSKSKREHTQEAQEDVQKEEKENIWCCESGLNPRAGPTRDTVTNLSPCHFGE
ncbi:uncharacterized protein BKA78DRAFT_293315 [Phyllosticta capitalensis]|uniref:uncharacterized protein n=1 Tax=Phyllosticta capitalensis TaxID=121624 RepID=UPI00312CDF20